MEDFPEQQSESPTEQAAFLLDIAFRELSERITAPNHNNSVVMGLPLALRIFEALRFSRRVLTDLSEVPMTPEQIKDQICRIST